MVIYIDHVNHIRKNLGIPEQSIEEAREEGRLPEAIFQELVCAMSDETVELKTRIKELEGSENENL